MVHFVIEDALVVNDSGLHSGLFISRSNRAASYLWSYPSRFIRSSRLVLRVYFNGLVYQLILDLIRQIVYIYFGVWAIINEHMLSLAVEIAAVNMRTYAAVNTLVLKLLSILNDAVLLQESCSVVFDRLVPLDVLIFSLHAFCHKVDILVGILSLRRGSSVDSCVSFESFLRRLAIKHHYRVSCYRFKSPIVTVLILRWLFFRDLFGWWASAKNTILVQDLFRHVRSQRRRQRSFLVIHDVQERLDPYLSLLFLFFGQKFIKQLRKYLFFKIRHLV